ncbi:anaphase-promoting complex subunit 12 [Mytilus galloprovincialis]|uniref:Anaphase-promoting complex subunit CDC26 n=1 Tax=Mytilus galloprovincialis TaxID=29158 RepID=A0A8B6ELL6_MYTGA|nr:anaphase-promoting complex subunit 12 [Mytilus galloprovincialis]VDI82295.1 anaphase-promoting complex subunit 12 [Mytilus galloprovincialis]
MLRRNPTRIEVKLDDLEEYNQMKKDKELEQAKQRLASSDCHTPTHDSIMDTRTRTEMIHERIGYDPKPHPQPTLQGTVR